MMFYVSAQFTATGKTFQMAFGEPYGITYAQGVLIGGLITILYTLVGGPHALVTSSRPPPPPGSTRSELR